MATKRENIIRVQFREPPLADQPAKTDFYFGSLAAIYEVFTPEQVGCKVECLWNAGITAGKPYANKLCIVTRETMTRKAQKTTSRKRNSDGQ